MEDIKPGEVLKLVDSYIQVNIIKKKKRDDAYHIAFCTVYKFDILLSWNFKHPANIKQQSAVNSYNFKQGHKKQLYIISPLEVGV